MEFKKQLQKEKKDLNEKIVALYTFVYSNPAFEDLDKTNKALLQSQLTAMKRYIAILSDRLELI